MIVAAETLTRGGLLGLSRYGDLYAHGISGPFHHY
jgi:hypothetical protein